MNPNFAFKYLYQRLYLQNIQMSPLLLLEQILSTLWTFLPALQAHAVLTSVVSMLRGQWGLTSGDRVIVVSEKGLGNIITRKSSPGNTESVIFPSSKWSSSTSFAMWSSQQTALNLWLAHFFWGLFSLFFPM